MKNLNKTIESGRSMIEMLGVLAIIGVLSVGGIAGYSKAMMKYKINKTIEQITQISQNIRTFYSSKRNYSDLDSTVIKKAKLVPDEMWDTHPSDRDQIINEFGGIFYLYAIDKSTSDDKKAFYIAIQQGIPEEACIEIVSQDWTASGVNGIGVMNTSENWTYLKTPAEMDDVITACTDSYFIWLYFDIDLSSNLWSSDFN